MAKDGKGHGSEKKTLGQTGRTAKEYAAFLRSEGSPETLARKSARSEGDKRSDAKASKPINKRGDTFKPKDPDKERAEVGVDRGFRSPGDALRAMKRAEKEMGPSKTASDYARMRKR